ncbi:protein FATTY ACID EXPORT 4, chloroplastic isoform X3 [Amborella trichopoda]|uniref:protein FATTY ACID EXPORT 4, chloroplastic isoform X3 n=1 Tax=Amborella trichopoda TaxID=13333 RepID=UPI0009BE6FA3|nr:protein FATTY ACID EXPORT 4, chloroplastic isoform X3 [Amborella trichopoda]|eukprot:XP_020525849.1 protein FATTY ACID EXPORT 4, chloroplastic isoform X3 [Amborella trichopoda]
MATFLELPVFTEQTLVMGLDPYVALLNYQSLHLQLLLSMERSSWVEAFLPAYFLMQVPETRIVADALGFGSALLFSAVFGIRLAATRKLVPAGPLLGLSVCALAVFISAFLHDRI